jgi:hypothetical protein
MHSNPNLMKIKKRRGSVLQTNLEAYWNPNVAPTQSQLGSSKQSIGKEEIVNLKEEDALAWTKT